MDISGISGDSTTSSISDKQLFGAAVVSGTLDKMNEDNFGKTNSDYDFQKSVLAAGGLGKNVDVSV